MYGNLVLSKLGHIHFLCTRKKYYVNNISYLTIYNNSGNKNNINYCDEYYVSINIRQAIKLTN